MNADEYVDTVLGLLPPGSPMRPQIAMDLRAHIAERFAAGHSLDDVLRQLGDPAKLAESYLAAEPLVAPPFQRRAAAKLIDLLAALVVAGAIAGFLSWRVPGPFVIPVFIIATLMCGSVLLGIYTVIAEARTAQTIGKRAIGLRVVRESGARISVGQAIVRQLPLVLQVIWVDAMFALFTEKSQRAFELLSKTRVVLAPSQEAV
jgi:uncharacterized RDD family membrane protein YckC